MASPCRLIASFIVVSISMGSSERFDVAQFRAFNQTHGSETPEHHGEEIESHHWQLSPGGQYQTQNEQSVQGCKTQIKRKNDFLTQAKSWVRKLAKKNVFCTSCKPGYAFMTMLQPYSSGLCSKFMEQPQVRCWSLDAKKDENAKNGYYAYQNGMKNAGCTKVLRSVNLIQLMVTKKFDEAIRQKAYDHFKTVRPAAGQWDRATYSVCDVRKETICRGSKCSVSKHVDCKGVCQVLHSKKSEVRFDDKYIAENCDKTVCAANRTLGQYGDLVCDLAAKME